MRRLALRARVGFTRSRPATQTDARGTRASWKRRLGGAAAAALAFLAAGCGSGGDPAHGPTLRIQTSPFRVSLVENGRTLVAEDAGARLRFQLASTGDQYSLTKVLSSHGGVYRVGTTEPGRTATVTVGRTRTGFRIAVSLHPAAGVQQVYDAFDTASGDHFLGGGERGGAADLRGQILPLEVSVDCSYAPAPFFASSAGWALRLDSENVGAFAFPGSPGGGGCQGGARPPGCTFPPLPERAEVCVQGAALEETLYAGGFARTLADYEADTGEPAVPPPFELALVKWRDVVSGPQQVLDDIARLRAARVPIGWVELDNPWETCMGSLSFDRGRIPDPAALVREVHARGVRFMLWISPNLECDDGYTAKDWIEIGGKRVLDLRKPAVVAEFRARLRRLVALGIDGVKADRGDELDLTGLSPALTNEYPLLYARAVVPVLRKPAAGYFRAATAGSQSLVPGLWAGDEPGDWIGLQRAIVAGETAGASGFPTWGSDVGGFSSAGLTGDVFARWAGLGAISPIFEVGGTGPNAVPWTMGPAAMDALRQAAVLHYELFPYLYGLLERRQPVLRPLGFGFPADAKAWQATFELLVGPDLLAAPVVGGGTTPAVYLPRGRWIDLHTGRTVSGPASFVRPTPLDELPLYARAGSVIPFDLRTAAGSWWGVDELTHPGRAGFLATDGSTIDLRGQPRGVQIFVPAPRRPARVTLGGRPVAWSWSPGPLPGAVVRLHGPSVRGRISLKPA